MTAPIPGTTITPAPTPDIEPVPQTSAVTKYPQHQGIAALMVEHKRLDTELDKALRRRYDAEYQAHTHALDIERITLAIESVESAINAVNAATR